MPTELLLLHASTAMLCYAVQAYERQLEAANRATRRGGEAADGLDRERQALLEQLRAAEQVRRAGTAATMHAHGCIVPAVCCSVIVHGC